MKRLLFITLLYSLNLKCCSSHLLVQARRTFSSISLTPTPLSLPYLKSSSESDQAHQAIKLTLCPPISLTLASLTVAYLKSKAQAAVAVPSFGTPPRTPNWPPTPHHNRFSPLTAVLSISVASLTSPPIPSPV